MFKRKLFQDDDENPKQFKIECYRQEQASLPVNNVSIYFQTKRTEIKTPIESTMLQLQAELNKNIKNLDIKATQVEYIYNPLVYAFDPYEKYVRRYCTSTKALLFVGMNPGPFGMCQTGVPFGDPKCVKEFLQIEGVVNKPEIECPDRKIFGFTSPRKEQSGERFWNFFQNLCGTPDVFFKNAFVLNYCPIALMKKNGCNVTPADMKPIQIRKQLEQTCEDWYLKVINVLKPKLIIAVGTYVKKKTDDLLKKNQIDDIKVLCMPHPSPRVVNNQNWPEKAQKFIDDHNLSSYFSA